VIARLGLPAPAAGTSLIRLATAAATALGRAEATGATAF
jgi:hypothetical protein